MTGMFKGRFAFGLTVFLLMLYLISFVGASTIQVDKSGTVLSVVDGSSFSLDSGETVKLSSIDTPAAGNNGYAESKSYLTGLILGKTVYLTVDSSANDSGGRLVAVAYLDFNSTFYENVNLAMIQNGYAIPVYSSNSTFNPGNWVWFISKQAAPTFTPTPSPAPTATPSPSPSPTPFNPPTPDVSPIIPEFPASTIFLVALMTVLSVFALLYKKRK